MNRLMNRTAVSALADADLALFVVEATRWSEEDGDVLERIRTAKVPCIALLNKIDAVHPKERLLAAIDEMSRRHDFVEIIPVSARKRDNLDVLEAGIRAFLPESPPLFPAEMQTDRSPQFHAAEVIREKLTIHLRDELPYGLTVQVEQYSQDRDRLTIHAVIWVERKNQKGIVIGKGGERLREIGKQARQDMERMYAAMDIFVLPSTCREAFGMVLIEAMAMIKPVIATPMGGIPEIIDDKVNAIPLQ